MAFEDPGMAASAAELLNRNENAAKVHRPEPLLKERPAGSPKPKTFIFCCFDPRVDPTTFLGLNPWDCGALHMTEEGIKGYLKDRHLGSEEQIEELVFEVGNQLQQRVRDNVKLIKDSPFVREELKARTKGLIYDIKTGVLTEVK
ncbi:hypothetical protein N8I77_006688 [Diaporthe amygdali]|uniref:Carbonic anhydrase n=1 Tax=Phomopsis amygdali TaxID=1214568 RepID=A0AAD9SJP0_PHOAM|nr:hypothetical protein N8I77_006688 [Diaporthe amygdali]